MVPRCGIEPPSPVFQTSAISRLAPEGKIGAPVRNRAGFAELRARCSSIKASGALVPKPRIERGLRSSQDRVISISLHGRINHPLLFIVALLAQRFDVIKNQLEIRESATRLDVIRLKSTAALRAISTGPVVSLKSLSA